MIKYLLLLALSTSASAVDFRQYDKQNDFVAGCGVASMFRGFARDAEYDHRVAVGMGGAILVSYLYESTKPVLQTQDIAAMTIGAAACMTVAEGYALVFGKEKVTLSGGF
jgi:hypothetical protein